MKPTFLMDIQDARADAKKLEDNLKDIEVDFDISVEEEVQLLRDVMQTFEDMRREIERLEAKLEASK